MTKRFAHHFWRRPPSSPAPFVRSRESREFWFSLVAILAVGLFGTAGFHFIEDWDLFDSLYMTIITLSTVGYGEVSPLSDEGRAFAMVLIVMGVGVVMVVFTTVAHAIIQRQIKWVFERKSMQERISNLREHTIVCGYGRLSRIVAGRLTASKIPIVVIDANEESVNAAIHDGHLVVAGDATDDSVLSLAGVMHARNLLSLLPRDAENLYVILASRECNRDLFIITRAEDDIGEKRLRSAGANRVMAPYRVGGEKIADGLLRPYVTDFIDLAVSDPTQDLQIEEIRIPVDSPLAGKSLMESEIRQVSNVIVAAIIPELGKMQFNPSGGTIIEAGSTLIGMGSRGELGKLEDLIIGKNR